MNISAILPNLKSTSKKNIFISYRVNDTSGETGRLVDCLKQYFPEDQIFMDIEKIEPGVDFSEAISKSLESCDVMLAVIGPGWLGTDHNEKSRISNPNDWVRLEVGTALQRNIRVVPVLVDGAALPEPEQLPPDLQPLLKRQAYEISNKRWKYDTDQLIAFLEKLVGIPPKKSEPNKTKSSARVWKFIVGGLAAFGALAIIAALFYEESPSSKTNNDYYNTSTTQKVNSPPENTIETDNTIQKNTASYKDVQGTWEDANGLYYLALTQNESNISVQSYSTTGMVTGNGLGTIANKTVRLNINVTNFGTIAINANLSDDEDQLIGTTTITNNGYSYSEPLRLNRRNY